MTENSYEVELLDNSTFKIFKGVYNDFKSKAISEYKFELQPLEYEEFVDAVEKGYLKCIVLKENNIPTAFLVYTTSVSESIELNIIHCLGAEDEITKQKLLIERFLELTETEMTESLGYCKIWNCGLIKYVWKKKIINSDY
jgi:hypothetical protein